MAQQIVFNKTNLNSIVAPQNGKRIYFSDKRQSNLGMSVTPGGVKSFFVVKRFDGNTRRVTLGRYPDITPDIARTKAIEVLSAISKGINPIAEKRSLLIEGITLQQVLEDYLIDRKQLKPRTATEYRNAVEKIFTDWADKPINKITREKVRQKHASYGKKCPACANRSFRALRAICNFAIHRYETQYGNSVIDQNPVKILSDTKAWYKIKRRQTYIESDDLPKWFRTVTNLPNLVISENSSTVRDYLYFLLFTGVRRGEALSLKWKEVNLNLNYFTLIDTKNRETVKLPICSFLQKILSKRFEDKVNEYVFPGDGLTGHLVNAHKQIQHVKNISGVSFSAHDLRRTFATIGEGLEIGHITLKRLLNHKSGESNVTSGYVIANNDRLLFASQKISEYILKIVKR